MKNSTYGKLNDLYQKYTGYIGTRELLEEGFTNRQIAALTEEEYLEKICHGYYWMIRCGHSKPMDYKCIEVSLSNPRAVICLGSACFYQGAERQEPEALAVATERTDRSLMKMNFPVERHYFSPNYYKVAQKKIDTVFGSYRIYDVERSICDLIRLGKVKEAEAICSETGYGAMHFDAISHADGKDMEREEYQRLLKYAELFRVRKNFIQ